MTQIHLPFPPSTNSLFKNRKGGRCKTEAYKAWSIAAEEALLKQLRHKRNHTGEVDIQIHLKSPDKRLSDADNRIKAVLDFLVQKQIIIDDNSKYVKSIYVCWSESTPVGCYVNVKDIL